MIAPSPAQQAQRRLLDDILATGCASPALAAAATTFPDPFDALRSLPVTGYEPYAADARGCVDALRAGDVPTARGHLAKLLARVPDKDTDPTHVLGFLQTSGTSGNACKFFPLTRAAQEARSTYYRVIGVLAQAKQASAHDDGVRLSLVTPGLPVELPSLLVDEVAASTEADPAATTAPASTPASPLDHMVDPAGLRVTRVGPATAVMLGPVLKHLAAQPADAPDVVSDTDIMGGATLAFPVRIVCAFDAPPAAKHYMMWLCALAKGGDRVTQMADFFGGSILSAVGVLREHAGSIAAALRAGKLSAGFPGDTFAGASISDAMRAAVDTYIGGPQPAAADALEAALASGKPLLAVLFPRLNLVSAIFTGSMAKYAPRVAALCPPGTILATDVYGGSEGYYGSAVELMTPGPRKADPLNRLVLAPAADVLFEFLEVGKEDDPPVLLPDVTLNTNYEVVITTYGGLARYRVGDIVKVVDFAAIDTAALAGGDAALEADLQAFNGAPIIEFVGRAGAMLNLVWEKYDEAALVAALGSGDHPWAEFAIREEPAPSGGGLPHYVVYVEPPAGGELDGKATAAAIESALRTQNEIYALLITRGQIAPAVVAVTRHGAFAALKESAVARGASAAQYKAPVCLESSADGLRSGVLEGWVVERVRAGV